MQLQHDFWKNKKVLVTGHSGFKGGWLTIMLDVLGANMAGLSLSPLKPQSLFEYASLSKRENSFIQDINNIHEVTETINKFEPEIIIHMAAQPLVRYSYKNPLQTLHTNIIGTANIFEAARNVDSVSAILNVTSDKCYKNKEWMWSYREIEELGGDDIYSVSKACSELITNAYLKSFYENSETTIATARAGNVIGGGDWSEDRLVPEILAALENESTICIRNPYAVRPWQHVIEPLFGYLMLIERLVDGDNKCSGAWNFGPEQDGCKSVEWVSNKFSETWPAAQNWNCQFGAHPKEATLLKLDNTKAKTILGWKPKWDLPTTIENVVSWHKKFIQGEHAYKLCRSQLEAYLQE